MNTFEQEVARNHARAMEIGRRMAGPDAAVAPAMITTRGGMLRKRKKNGTVVAALASGVLHLQPVEPVELGPTGDEIELPPEKIASVATKPVEAPEQDGKPLCAGLVVKVNTVDQSSFELSFLDGSGELFRDHSTEARAEIKSAYDAFVAWVPAADESA
ncbi:MAG: hypothetical protein JHD02_01175 [Thermoleophilaceae bacterium]|nr:hypothetical protein [Thermoleophilaceae bacterium]